MKEYDMGHRSLLDLLAVQGDIINAKSKFVEAKYDRAFAEYRILDAMGTMVSSIVNNKRDLKNIYKPIDFIGYGLHKKW